MTKPMVVVTPSGRWVRCGSADRCEHWSAFTVQRDGVPSPVCRAHLLPVLSALLDVPP